MVNEFEIKNRFATSVEESTTAIWWLQMTVIFPLSSTTMSSFAPRPVYPRAS